MKVFPARFDPSPTVWRGARARQHTARDDAFQQLVGDALRTAAPGSVATFGTAGRDGSIDAFISVGVTLPGVVGEVASPAVVECKDNDDSADDVQKNVLEAWRKLAEKLEEKAAAGWPDLYQPWRDARGYVYATSARLPHQKARDALRVKVEAFFERLRASGRCQIERVRVVDWNDLRPFFDGCAGLADKWLGAETTKLLTHDERLGQLNGFARYLRDLPFVEPGNEHPTHPARLFTRLATLAGQRGVLVIGPGGVGKTRALLEVARLAYDDGWRVLHTAGWERGLTQEDLEREILDGSSKVLLLIDYLTQLRQIDPRWVRYRLLPSAMERGIKAALLASARPAHRFQLSEDWCRLFDVIDLDPGPEHTDRLIERMLDLVPIQAAQRLGRDRVRNLAGKRPIIALFMMQELERQVASTSLPTPGVHVSPWPELMEWLSERLDEDGLSSPRPASAWARASATPQLLASAAVLCATPQPPEVLRQAAEYVLRAAASSASDGDPREQAAQVMSALSCLGWLEKRDNGDLAVAHDVVADEVLRRALYDGTAKAFNRTNLQHLLEPCRWMPKILGRMVSVVDRLRNDLPELIEFKQWLTENADNIGSSLAKSGDADGAVYMLTSSDTCSEVVSRSYGEVLRPWLDRQGNRLEAAIAMLTALGHVKVAGTDSTHLCEAAASWCMEHDESQGILHIGRQLLMRDDVPTHVALKIIDRVFPLIERDDCAELRVGVVSTLLNRPELDRERAIHLMRLVRPTLAAYAERKPVLLSQHHGEAWSHFEVLQLLRIMLARRDVPSEMVQDVLKSGLTSLDHFQHGTGAGILLPSLLGRDDLGADDEFVFSVTGRWLARYRAEDIAGQVIVAAARRWDAVAGPMEGWRRTLDEWLSVHGASEAAGQVLMGVTRQKHGLATDDEWIVKALLRWLGSCGRTLRASKVLTLLLSHPSLHSEAALGVIATALSWLEVYPDSPATYTVIASLLERVPPDAVARFAVVEAALKWMEAHTEVEHLFVVVNAFLKSSDIGVEHVERATQVANLWLRQHGSREFAGAMLMALFTRARHFPSEDRDATRILETINVAIGWLIRHDGSPLFEAVILAYLFSGFFVPVTMVHARRQVFAWLLRRSASTRRLPIVPMLHWCIERAAPEQVEAMRTTLKSLLSAMPASEDGPKLLIDLGLKPAAD